MSAEDKRQHKKVLKACFLEIQQRHVIFWNVCFTHQHKIQTPNTTLRTSVIAYPTV